MEKPNIEIIGAPDGRSDSHPASHASSLGAKNKCTFSGGNEPCPICPRKITMMYMCGILKNELARHQNIHD
jgi:hypothetical protein